jgi:hypothetical protein
MPACRVTGCAASLYAHLQTGSHLFGGALQLSGRQPMIRCSAAGHPRSPSMLIPSQVYLGAIEQLLWLSRHSAPEAAQRAFDPVDDREP